MTRSTLPFTKHGYAAKAVLRERLRHAGPRLLLLDLLDEADRKTGAIRASYRYLIDKLDVPKKTFERQIKVLVDAGEITREPGISRNGESTIIVVDYLFLTAVTDVSVVSRAVSRAASGAATPAAKTTAQDIASPAETTPLDVPDAPDAPEEEQKLGRADARVLESIQDNELIQHLDEQPQDRAEEEQAEPLGSFWSAIRPVVWRILLRLVKSGVPASITAMQQGSSRDLNRKPLKRDTVEEIVSFFLDEQWIEEVPRRDGRPERYVVTQAGRDALDFAEYKHLFSAGDTAEFDPATGEFVSHWEEDA